jgi:hypothetical protein
MNKPGEIKVALERASLGWTTCGACEDPFLSVLGARVRCPHCGHVFSVESVQLAQPEPRLDESRTHPRQKLLRVEICCARAWAEALADGDLFYSFGFQRAWQQIRALRFGQVIAFVEKRK